jgi:hypothetical protein
VPLTIGCRNLIACCTHNKACAQSVLQQTAAALGRIRGGSDEPMFNIVAHCRDDRYSVAFFPREKHRSACYFAAPEQRLSISPAAIEMAGIIVVADSSHFDRVDEAAVRAMYEEVTVDFELVSRIAEELLP